MGVFLQFVDHRYNGIFSNICIIAIALMTAILKRFLRLVPERRQVLGLSYLFFLSFFIFSLHHIDQKQLLIRWNVANEVPILVLQSNPVQQVVESEGLFLLHPQQEL